MEKACSLFPRDKRMFLALAEIEYLNGDSDDAIATLDQGLKALPAQTDMLWLLANYLIDDDTEPANRERAREMAVQMKKAKAPPTAVDYIQARLLLVDGRWSEAAKLLETTRPQMERDQAPRSLLNQVDLYLARCYEELDEPARQLASLERVVAREEPHDGGSVFLSEARRALANLQWGLGRLDDAIGQQRKLLSMPNPAKTAWTDWIQMLVARNLARADRDWSEVEGALRLAEKALPNELDVTMLRVRVLLLQEDTRKASALLEAAKKQFPQSAEPWAALVALAEAQKEPEKAHRLLDDAQRQSGDSVGLRLARARFWASRREKEGAPNLTALVEGLDQFSPDDQVQLLRGLIESSFCGDNAVEKHRLWGMLAALPRFQNDLRIKLMLFDQALQAGDTAASDKVLADLQRVEGGQGVLATYCAALRLLRMAKPGDDAGLEEARGLLDKVAAQRPSWPTVHLARGDLETLRQNPDQAIIHYREAIRQGEHSSIVLRRLVKLLTERGRTEEADQELRKLPWQALVAGNLQWVAVDLAIRNQDPARGARIAAAAVPRDSKDYHDYLWFGQALAADGRRPEAEQQLRKAVTLAPDKGEPYVALVQLHMSGGQKVQAEQVVEEARGRLPADQVNLTLARCYEALGRPEQASRQYQEALRTRPDDLAVLRNAVLFHQRGGRLTEAEGLLRLIVDGKVKSTESDVAWARRRLALVLAASREPRQLLEALRLVGLVVDASGKVVPAGAASATLAVEEQRARAQVLATQARKAFRDPAISLLEDLGKRQALTTDDQFLLARLYEANGELPKAVEQRRAVATAQNKSPTALAAYAQLLLRQGEAAEAQRWVDQLRELEKKQRGEANGLGSVDLQAQLFEARREDAKSLELVTGYARRKGARPEDLLLLVACLTRQKKAREALDVCDEAWENCAPEAVGGASVSVLHVLHPDVEQHQRVQRRLEAALKKTPKAPQLLLQRASVQELRSDYTQAQATYRQVLELDPGNVVALNNLAWLLARTAGDGKEAFDLIERAIARSGEHAELLDTRAVVEMRRGQSQQAIADLEKANGESRKASRYFLLAQAYQMARDHEAAVNAFREAKALGLTQEQLHPLEQTAYSKIAKELDTP
jgi:tetratricopeptide (TPR) repeat protein